VLALLLFAWTANTVGGQVTPAVPGN
jgi:hypothetical protein